MLKANGLTDAYLRPLAWRGSEQLAVSAQQTKIHLMIACWSWPNLFGADRLKGATLGLAEWRRPHPQTAPTASKAAGLYMIGTLAKHAAEAQGFNDALMLTWDGYVGEATGANIFFVIDGKLHTPIPGLLPGRHHPPRRHRSRPGPRYRRDRAPHPVRGYRQGERSLRHRHRR